jgi:hypothetical protein
MNNDFSAVSICETYTDSQGRLRGFRLCDVKEDKTICKFERDLAMPSIFENRESIYLPGESKDAEISLWEWSATPSKNDPKADYVTASLSYETPIKAIRCSWAETHRQIVKRLKADGIEIAMPSCRTLFIARDSSGIIVEANDLAEMVGNVRLKNRFLKLLLIDNISEHQLIECENRVAKTSHTFYYTLHPQNTSSLLLNLRNIIAKVINNRLKRNLNGAALQTVENLLELAQLGNVYEEVAAYASPMSVEEAKKHVDNFLGRIPFVSDVTDVQILGAVIEKDQELFNRCLEIVETRLENQRTELIMEIEKKKEEQAAMEKELLSLVEDTEAVRLEREEQREFQESFLERIDDKILELQTSSSAYYAETLSHLLPFLSAHSQRTTPSAAVLFTPGIIPESAEERELTEGDDAICTIDDAITELVNKDLDKDLSFMLSSFLYSIYARRLSLLLAGPEGMRLAEAFSLVVSGKTPDLLECSGDWNKETLDLAFADSENVLVVTTPFNGAWFERLILKIAQRTKTVILLTPFATDLQFEPEGLYDYVLPLVTDAFVMAEIVQSEKVYVGVRTENFKEDEYSSDQDGNYKLQADHLKMRRRTKNITSSILQKILDKPETKFLYYCILSFYPYAVLTGKRELFDKIVQENSQQLTPEMLKIFTQF